jgi:hypothetical protein
LNVGLADDRDTHQSGGPANKGAQAQQAAKSLVTPVTAVHDLPRCPPLLREGRGDLSIILQDYIRKCNKETMKAWSLFLLFSVLPGRAVDGAVFNQASRSEYLYEGKEDATAVTEYKTGVDFMDSKAPKIVEFYSPHCG